MIIGWLKAVGRVFGPGVSAPQALEAEYGTVRLVLKHRNDGLVRWRLERYGPSLLDSGYLYWQEIDSNEASSEEDAVAAASVTLSLWRGRQFARTEIVQPFPPEGEA